ncbi:MAG: hypothetical protein Q8R92_08930 [Deltaproteobacteria bacterium]|nr:hypothetical protein [Deltaproteobacteria bacterium]
MNAFLVIVMIVSGHGTFQSSTEMPSMEACLKVLSEVKIVIPNGAENESAAVAFCSTEDHGGLFRWH